MKIAEALTESKRLGNLIPALLSQFGDNCIIVNGEKPDRDPVVLLEKVQAAIGDKAKLDRQITLTNAATKLPCGLTIHEAILRKASLKLTISSAAGMTTHLRSGKRLGYNEEKGTRKEYAVKPERVEAIANEAAKELRSIESQMQQANWVVDLI